MEIQSAEPSLQEALQQIGDWGADVIALFGLEEQTTSPPPASSTSSRKRAAGGPATKMQEYNALVEELGEVQRKVESSYEEAAARDDASDADTALRNEWKEIAMRQREQRVAVEVENHKLRKVLDAQRTTSRRASALVRKVSIIATALGSSPEARVENYKGPRVDVATHLTRLEHLTRDAPAVFSSGRFAEHANPDFRDVAYTNLGDKGFLVELTASWVLPFHVESVVEALWWQTTRVPRKEKTTNFEDIYTAARTMVSRFVSEAKVLGTIDAAPHEQQPVRGSTHGQIATRGGSPASDGSVLLVSHMDVKNFKPDGSCRSLMQGTGFLRVEPVGTQDAAPACRVQWCRRMQGRAPDDTVETMTEYSKWAHVLTSGNMRKQWWSSIEQNLQAIENALIDAAAPDRREPPRG